MQERYRCSISTFIRMTKSFLKTKRMRRLIKQARMWYKNEARRDGIRHIRPRNLKLCSECDPLTCICRDNQRACKLIEIYRKHPNLLTSTELIEKK